MAGRLKRLTTSFFRYGPGHVLEVLRRYRARKAYARERHELPSPSDLIVVFPASVDSAPTLVEHLNARAAKLTLPWLVDTASTDTDWHSLSAQDPTISESTARAISEHARRFASGRFTALGLSINESNGTYDWHRDYGARLSWPRDHFSSIDFLRSDGSDARFPWELNRFYWIGWLGIAHDRNPDEGHDRAFVRQVDHWMEENPVDVGINWAMPMEVAIRGFWLTAGAALFRDSNAIDVDWWSRYHALIQAHGKYLEQNLEYFPIPTNHYISNCMGLTVVGALFRDSERGRAWMADGRKRLLHELDRQILPDGVDYERSIPYHGHVLEMMLIACIVLDRAGEPLPDVSLRVIDRMVEFSSAYMPPGSGQAPLMGDGDDGQILRLNPDRSPYDHRHLVRLHKRQQSSGTSDSAKAQSRLRHFPNGGYSILRSGDIWCCIDCGPIGLHGNNDALSFVLNDADGMPWIVDRGTPCYNRSPALRNAYRSSRSHNGPVVNGQELAAFAGLWRVRREIDVVAVDATPGQEEGDVTFAARHSEFRNDIAPVTVQRRWNLNDAQLEVIDSANGSGAFRVSTCFCLHPDVSAEQATANEVILSRSNAGRDSRQLRITCSLPIEIVKSDCSPSYGLVVPTLHLEVVTDATDASEIRYLCEFVSPDEPA